MFLLPASCSAMTLAPRCAPQANGTCAGRFTTVGRGNHITQSINIWDIRFKFIVNFNEAFII